MRPLRKHLPKSWHLPGIEFGENGSRALICESGQTQFSSLFYLQSSGVFSERVSSRESLREGLFERVSLEDATIRSLIFDQRTPIYLFDGFPS